MKLTEEGRPSDASVYAFLQSVCETESETPSVGDRDRIRWLLTGCGMIDRAGRPTERAYDLYHRIPVRPLGTADVGYGYLSTACVLGYRDNEEHDSIIRSSGLIIANILDGSAEIVGTDNADIACRIGMMIGRSDAGPGDLVIAAIDEEPAKSFELAMSIALKVA